MAIKNLKSYVPTNYQLCLHEAAISPLLTFEDEKRLAQLMHDDGATAYARESARNALISSNLRLVISIVNNNFPYVPANMTKLDLIQAGNLGLITAADKYDWERGFRFSTCATPWIKQAIMKYIMDNSRDVRIPAHIFQLKSKYKKLVVEREQANPQLPTDDETMAKILNIDVEKVKLLRSNQLATIMSMDATANGDGTASDDEDVTLLDLVQDERNLTPLEYTEQKILEKDVQDAISKLPLRTQKIIKMRFGLGIPGVDPDDWQREHTLEEVGLELDLTRERIRQIEKKTLQEDLKISLEKYLN